MYSEDITIIKIVEGQKHIVKAFFEVAKAVPSSVGADISKLTEALLYPFYQLSKEESCRPVITLYTDLYRVHSFLLHRTRQSQLHIKEFQSWQFIEDDDSLGTLLQTFTQLFLKIHQLPDE